MTIDLTRSGLRARTIAAATVLAALMIVGCNATSAAEDSSTREQRNTEVVRSAFALGVGGDEHTFFSILAEDVHWTVARAIEPKTYTSRSEFLQDGAGPIQSRLTAPIQARVRQLIAKDDDVVAIWDGTATARDGRAYVNSYAWVMTMRDERVVRATAFLDMVVLNDLLERVEPA